MARSVASVLPMLIGLFSSLLLLHGSSATIFTFDNNCPFTVWPVTLSGASSSPLPQTGFELGSGFTTTLTAPSGWSGRMWARTECSTDASGHFSCVTGDCGSGAVSCDGKGSNPPATLVEFTLNGDGGKDFYDTSLVNGFNVPMSITPQGAGGTECSSCGCPADVNAVCPSELQEKSPDGRTVEACKSACLALGQPQYCCTGAFGSPAACKPTTYSQLFKEKCPQAYSYLYDDPTSTFTCVGADYRITFCP